MRVLITGATGFLGRYVVAAAVRRGHEVRTLVRPSRKLDDDFFPAGITIARCDVRDPACLPAALENIDAVIHLAACVVGDDDAQFASTVVGTENLLAAMVERQVTRLIHCSSFSVYDWQQPGSQLTEQSDLEPRLYERDGYAISKIWQERLVSRTAAQQDWDLTLLRPGFIWGPGKELLAGIGPSVGRWHFVIGGRRSLPLTYVENCADCFITALEHTATEREAYNVIDSDTVSAWQYMGACLDAGVVEGRRIYVPYWVGITTAKLANWTSRLLFGPKAKLPGLFVPIKFRARFRPFAFPNHKIREQLDWNSTWSFPAAWHRIAAAKHQTSRGDHVPKPASERERSLV